jgi:hypothetical protein
MKIIVLKFLKFMLKLPAEQQIWISTSKQNPHMCLLPPPPCHTHKWVPPSTHLCVDVHAPYLSCCWQQSKCACVWGCAHLCMSSMYGCAQCHQCVCCGTVVAVLDLCPHPVVHLVVCVMCWFHVVSCACAFICGVSQNGCDGHSEKLKGNGRK